MAGFGSQRRGLIETPSARLDSFVSTNFSRGGGAAIILHPYSVLGGSMNDPQCLELMRCGVGRLTVQDPLPAAASPASQPPAHPCCCRVASASPAFSLVVRYNQRGVGRSSGRCVGSLLPPLLPQPAAAYIATAAVTRAPSPLAHLLTCAACTCSVDMRGKEDMADVLDVVEWAAEQLPGSDKQVAVIGCVQGRRHTLPQGVQCESISAQLVLGFWAGHRRRFHPPVCVGSQRVCSEACTTAQSSLPNTWYCRYSWGSCLAAYALSHPAVVAYVGVSFPLGGLSWVLQTKKHFGELCRSSHVPRLLILGDQASAGRVSVN